MVARWFLVRRSPEGLAPAGGTPELTSLISQWAAGDFSALPPIEVLEGFELPGAEGGVCDQQEHNLSKWRLSTPNNKIKTLGCKVNPSSIPVSNCKLTYLQLQACHVLVCD